MRPRIDELQSFYEDPLGVMAATMAQRRLRTLWPGAENLDILGFGYVPPYFSPRFRTAHRLISAMPYGQGAAPHLFARGNASCLVAEDGWPFPPGSFDRILMVHGLEHAGDPNALLKEAWRTLRPEGRIAIITANRTGLWARSDKSPFGVGRPFSRMQLATALKDTGFKPTVWSGALYAPPWGPFRSLSYFEAWESIGERFWSGFSGLILVEAIKRVYSEPMNGETASATEPAWAMRCSPVPGDSEDGCP